MQSLIQPLGFDIDFFSFFSISSFQLLEFFCQDPIPPKKFQVTHTYKSKGDI